MPEIAQLFKSPRCQHVHYSGKPCKAPARRGRNYCVFHQAAHLDPGGCVLPIVEDVHSYQLAIIRIARALADDVIDARKATALLYAMQLAGYQLNEFANQRAEVEDPHRALKNEISTRYNARKYPFPSHVPEQDLLSILKELRAEQPVEPIDNLDVIPQRQITNPPSPEPCAMSPEPVSSGVIPSEDAAISAAGFAALAASESRNLHGSQPTPTPCPEPALSPACHPEADAERSEGEAEGPMHFRPQSIDPSSGLRPPQDDSRQQPGAA